MDEEKVSRLAALVPEVYYDLIARIPAGTFLVAALLVLYRPSLRTIFISGNVRTGPALILLLFLVVAGYSVGLLLSCIGELVIRVYWDRVWRMVTDRYLDLVPKAVAKLGMRYEAVSWEEIRALPTRGERRRASQEAHQQYRRMYRQLHDFLKDADPQAKVVLPKMQAEAALTSNLVAGLLFLVPALAFHLQTWRSPALIWDLIALLLSILSSAFRSFRLFDRHFSYLALVLNRPEKQQQSILIG